MKWSWQAGRLAGIELRIHATFLLLLAWVGATYWFSDHSLAAAMGAVGFIVALFGCVVLHELGHALAARGFGIPTRDITLLPIGGVARLERMPEKPAQELWVAIAGPLVNVAIAAALALAAGAGFGNEFTAQLLRANIWLVLFNLVPAFPMDGGRVLRALLATRLEYVKATRIAASVGQALAFVFGIAGLFGNPMLVLVALFVWVGATQEAGATQMKAVISGMPVQAAMITDFRAIDAADTLGSAARLTLEGSQQDFPVLERGRVAGILTREDLVAGLAAHGSDYPVAAAMRRDFPAAEYAEPLEPALDRLRASTHQTMPVLYRGGLVGLLTLENVGELFLIRHALRAHRATGPAS